MRNILVKPTSDLYQYFIEDNSTNINIENQKNSYSDPRLIKMILSQLLDNAIKFSKNGNIIIAYNISVDCISFSVEDKGIGINEDFKKLMYSPFTQEDESSTREYEGTGAGLAIVYGLVKILKGSIDIESTPSVGTTARVKLPNFEHNILLSKFANKSIIVVEDLRTDYEFLKFVLKKSNLRTIHSSSAADAIEICKHNKDISLVIMDIDLPDGNGIDCMLEIKKYNQNLPFIAVTAHNRAFDKETILTKGFDDFITKPIKKNLLIESILKLLK